MKHLMAANLSQFIRNLLCIGFFSSGLSTVCATELTSDDFYEREQVQEIRLTISGLNLKKMKRKRDEYDIISDITDSSNPRDSTHEETETSNLRYFSRNTFFVNLIFLVVF